MSDSEPALTPPSGVTSNFDHPHDVLRTVNLVTQALCIPIITVFVALRLYSRWTQLRMFGWDDYACMISWFLMIGYCVCCVMLSTYGGGYNQWDVRSSELEGYLKANYAAMVLYNPMALFVKLALLVILVRIFSPYQRSLLSIYIVMGLLIAYYVPAWIIKIRMCSPPSSFWKQEWQNCLNESHVFIADSVLSVASDLAILFLPLPLTWSLQMPKKKKIRVILLLGAGGLATAFSIYRLGMIIHESASQNQTIVFVKVVLTGNAEAGIGLICACLPAIATLITHHNKKSSTGDDPNSSSTSKRYASSSQHELSSTSRSKLPRASLRNNNGEYHHASSSSIGTKDHSHYGSNKFVDLDGEPLDLGCDEMNLVTYAQAAPETDSSIRSGIVRTVGVWSEVTYTEGSAAERARHAG